MTRLDYTNPTESHQLKVGGKRLEGTILPANRTPLIWGSGLPGGIFLFIIHLHLPQRYGWSLSTECSFLCHNTCWSLFIPGACDPGLSNHAQLKPAIWIFMPAKEHFLFEAFSFPLSFVSTYQTTSGQFWMNSSCKDKKSSSLSGPGPGPGLCQCSLPLIQLNQDVVQLDVGKTGLMFPVTENGNVGCGKLRLRTTQIKTQKQVCLLAMFDQTWQKCNN